MTEINLNLEEINPLEVYGVNNSRITQFKESYPETQFVARGNELKVKGSEDILPEIKQKIGSIIAEIRRRGSISEEKFNEILESGSVNHNEVGEDVILTGTHGTIIRAKTAGQREILRSAAINDILFSVGPAGTGKTYTAGALAVKALRDKQVRKIVLTRPAVEAGENLGFLPGDLKEKIDPYLRPLYDALEDMIQFEKLKGMLEKNIIEIAPLAYMRGRTLSNAFIILDEAQNATEMQIKMFLTRMGRESKIIITGDDSQTDLPRSQRSGLVVASKILEGIPGIGFVRLTKSDVVRHSLVRRIIQAYEEHQAAQEKGRRD